MNKNQIEFYNKGFTVLDDLIPPAVIQTWVDLVEFAAQGGYGHNQSVKTVKKVFEQADLETRDGAGKYDFTSINGNLALEFNHVKVLYGVMAKYISLLTGLDIVESWDKESSVTFMRYSPPSGQLVEHFDSNFITMVIYLTDNPNQGQTKILPISALRPTNLGQPDEVVDGFRYISPQKGRVLLFQGRRCWHSSEPVIDEVKISSVWNFYERNDNWRPKGVSERLYT
jgi:hypothetical protein